MISFFYAVADSNLAHAVLLVIMHIMHMHHFCILCTRTFVITSSCSWNLMELWWKIGHILLQSGKCGNKFKGANANTCVASNFNLRLRDALRLCGENTKQNSSAIWQHHWCLNLLMFSNLNHEGGSNQNFLTKLHISHLDVYAECSVLYFIIYTVRLHTSENYIFMHPLLNTWKVHCNYTAQL